MWVESLYPGNGIVNLDNVVQVKKHGTIKVYIQFKKSVESSLFWEYTTEEERDKEYLFIKEVINPSKLGRFRGK